MSLPLFPIGLWGARSTLWDGLSAYWELDEASGAAVDSGPNALHLTDNNTVGAAAGKVNGARHYTAAQSESHSRASEASLVIPGDLTITGWAYFDTLSGGQHLAAKGNTSAPGSGEYALWFNSSRFQATVSDGTVFHTATANVFGAPAAATWYHVTLRHRSGIDVGVCVNAGTFNTTAHTTGIRSGSGTFSLGADGSGLAARFWNGRIDNVQIWNRILTPAEITEDYNNGLAGRES